MRSSLTPEELDELVRVDALAEALHSHLLRNSERIASAHVHGAQSSAIQQIVSELLTVNLAFREEVVLAAEEGFVSRPRPDFFFELGQGRGILAEVERGGTVNNNHDLKDLWKTHIAQGAQHLFLIVPFANWDANGEPRERPYKRVVSRLGAFFGDPRREIDVLSLNIFGYGDASHSS